MSSPFLTPRDASLPTSSSIRSLTDAAAAITSLFASIRDLTRRVTSISLAPTDPLAPLHGARAGDLEAVWIEVLSPAKPDTEFEVAHFLGRTPIGFHAMPVGKPAIFYAPGTIGAHGWGPDTIKLRCNVANVSALVLVY